MFLLKKKEHNQFNIDLVIIRNIHISKLACQTTQKAVLLMLQYAQIYV